MSENKYGEPWTIRDSLGIDHHEHAAINSDGMLALEYQEHRMPLQRAILCVNACAGIPDEQIAQLAAVNQNEEAMGKFLKLAVATLEKQEYCVIHKRKSVSDMLDIQELKLTVNVFLDAAYTLFREIDKQRADASLTYLNQGVQYDESIQEDTDGIKSLRLACARAMGGVRIHPSPVTLNTDVTLIPEGGLKHVETLPNCRPDTYSPSLSELDDVS